MAISLKRAQKHTQDWSAQLGSRARWAKHLFFACHVTTAAKIIQTGCLLSRNSVGCIEHDIANQEALGTNPAAFQYVRLYFRPRTDFHLRTEGIKLLTDGYRFNAHMSVPVMFVLNLAEVLTMDDACYCDRKMAHVNVASGSDRAYFDAIDFSKVYHEGPITDRNQRREISDRRMAEVLIPDELPLAGNVLDAIVCRTRADAQTLQHLARGRPAYYLDKIKVSARPPEVFFCWGAYIEDLQFAGNALTVRVKPSHDYKNAYPLKYSIVQERNGQPHRTWDHSVPLSDKPLRITGFDPNVQHTWLIKIEDALAFHGTPPTPANNVFKN